MLILSYKYTKTQEEQRGERGEKGGRERERAIQMF
jgi:hypothetical protein